MTAAVKIGTYTVPADVAEVINNGAHAQLLEAMTDTDCPLYIPADSICGQDCQKAFTAFGTDDYATPDASPSYADLQRMLRTERLRETPGDVVRLVEIYMFG